MKNLPDTKLLHIFQVVAQFRNLSKAASVLGVTQSAVSHQIKRLETQLDVTLFERDTRPLQLTPIGHYFLTHARQYLQQLEKTVYLLRNQQALFMEELRVGMVSYIGDLFLVDIIKALESRVTSIDVNTASATDLNLSFLDQKYDVIITTQTSEIRDSLIEHKLCQQIMFGVTSYVSKNKSDKNAIIDTLLNEALFIDFPVSTQLGKLVKQYFFRLQKQPKRKITVNTIPNALQLLKAFPAWSMSLPLPMMNYVDVIEQQKIQYFMLPEQKLYEDIYLLAAQHVPNELIELIQKVVKSKINQQMLAKQLKNSAIFQDLVTLL